MAKTLDVSDTDIETMDGEQYVTFELSNETYAIEALMVKEIIELAYVTRVPNLPEFFKGVINLRGTIIPVIDTKMKFDMDPDDYKRHTCVIITEFNNTLTGLIVDAVSDVLYIPRGAISVAPSFGTTIRTDFVRGVGNIEGKLLIILDIVRVLTPEVFSNIYEAGGGV
jgi:purine-binding chemotaxis protein CheW